MITLIHGDNELQIYKTLANIKTHAKDKELITLQKPDALTLRQHLATPAMFFDNRLTVVERFFEKGTTQDVITFLSELPADTSAVFVEAKRLDRVASGAKEKKTKTLLAGKKLLDALKQVKGLQIIACNDYSLFDFLDQLKPHNAVEVLQRFESLLTASYEAQEVYYMIVDHVRNLIIAKDLGGSGLKDMHEFRQKKILGQARQFTLFQLLAIYQQLFQLEIAQKEKRVGEGSMFSMEDDLRFLLVHAFS